MAFPSTTLPRTPSSFTATPQSSTGIDLSWNFVSDATGYDVYTCAGSFIGNTTQTSYLVKGLNPETTYSYKVRANNDDGSSDFTACQTATTLSTDPDSYTLSGRTKKADGTPDTQRHCHLHRSFLSAEHQRWSVQKNCAQWLERGGLRDQERLQFLLCFCFQRNS